MNHYHRDPSRIRSDAERDQVWVSLDSYFCSGRINLEVFDMWLFLRAEVGPIHCLDLEARPPLQLIASLPGLEKQCYGQITPSNAVG